MWDSYLEGFVEALFPWSKPGSGMRSLGVWAICTRCTGRGYLKKSTNVWRPCPNCYAGHSWLVPCPDEEAERFPDPKSNVRPHFSTKSIVVERQPKVQ